MKNNETKVNVSIHIFYICLLALLLIILGSILYSTNAIESGGVNAVFDEIWGNVLTIALSIVCSILSSVLYTYAMKQKNEQDCENIRKNIKESIDLIFEEKVDVGVGKVSQKVVEICNETKELMPMRYYRSADLPNQEFNNFLNRKILESKKYIYYGESARFTCKRLYKLKSDNSQMKNLKIEIYIVNPTCEKIFESNKAFLKIKEINKNYSSTLDWEIIIKEEKMKVLYCLYALSKMKTYFQTINVYMINDVPFIDIEMTDDIVVLEFFRTQKDYKRYPLTMIYNNQNAYYESYEFYLEWEKEKAKLLKENDLTIDYVLTLGRKAGIDNITEQKLKEYCQKEIINELEQYI